MSSHIPVTDQRREFGCFKVKNKSEYCVVPRKAVNAYHHNLQPQTTSLQSHLSTVDEKRMWEDVNISLRYPTCVPEEKSDPSRLGLSIGEYGFGMSRLRCTSLWWAQPKVVVHRPANHSFPNHTRQDQKFRGSNNWATHRASRKNVVKRRTSKLKHWKMPG